MENRLSLDERKSLMLDILQKLLCYCEKNGLKCYLSSGTLLGAVRHKGFIPWDDDVDVMMPIRDYNCLVELTRDTPIADDIYLSAPRTNPKHMWPMLKVINRKTKLVEPSMTPKLRREQETFYGVYVDIFPMYGLPNDPQARLDFQNKLTAAYDHFKRATRVMRRRPQDSLPVFWVRRILHRIYTGVEKMRGGDYYLRQILAMTNEIPLEGAQYFGHAMGLTRGTIDHFKTEFYSSTCRLQFEHLECEAAAGYDELLRTQYGDYMVLPPVEQRRTHPSAVSWR